MFGSRDISEAQDITGREAKAAELFIRQTRYLIRRDGLLEEQIESSLRQCETGEGKGVFCKAPLIRRGGSTIRHTSRKGGRGGRGRRGGRRGGRGGVNGRGRVVRNIRVVHLSITGVGCVTVDGFEL
jgi:hypothetical protein